MIEVERREDRLCELVDGALVEKVPGFRESLLAAALAGTLRDFVVPRNLGLVSGPDGMLRLSPGLVRSPDVAFVSWDRIPDRRVPESPIPDLAPDLAVEVLSPSNTAAEMARKRGEYFAAGVRLVWLVDPRSRTVTVHDAEGRSAVLDETATLDGGAVLPGFALPLRGLFAESRPPGGRVGRIVLGSSPTRTLSSASCRSATRTPAGVRATPPGRGPGGQPSVQGGRGVRACTSALPRHPPGHPRRSSYPWPTREAGLAASDLLVPRGRTGRRPPWPWGPRSRAGVRSGRAGTLRDGGYRDHRGRRWPSWDRAAHPRGRRARSG